MDCSMHKAKTKALINCSATAQLTCTFDFAYAKSRFSHDVAQIMMFRTTKKFENAILMFKHYLFYFNHTESLCN